MNPHRTALSGPHSGRPEPRRRRPEPARAQEWGEREGRAASPLGPQVRELPTSCPVLCPRGGPGGGSRRSPGTPAQRRRRNPLPRGCRCWGGAAGAPLPLPGCSASTDRRWDRSSSLGVGSPGGPPGKRPEWRPRRGRLPHPHPTAPAPQGSHSAGPARLFRSPLLGCADPHRGPVRCRGRPRPAVPPSTGGLAPRLLTRKFPAQRRPGMGPKCGPEGRRPVCSQRRPASGLDPREGPRLGKRGRWGAWARWFRRPRGAQSGAGTGPARPGAGRSTWRDACAL